MRQRQTFRVLLLYPAIGAFVTGALAGGLAASVGWYGLPFGLAAALIVWMFRPGALEFPPRTEAPKMVTSEQRVRVDVVNLDGKQGDTLRFGMDAETLHKFAAGLIAGKSLATRDWQTLFTEPKFTDVCNELMSQGYARWISDRNHRGGRELTAKGKAMMRGLAAPLSGLRVTQNRL